MQDIQIPAQTRSPSYGSNPAHTHAIGKIQGRSELTHGRAQAPEAHPELMQGLWISISQYLGLEITQTPGLTADEIESEFSTREREILTCSQRR
jgi:hypothetical protein